MLFFILRRLLRGFVFSFLKLEVRGGEHLTERGPLLLVGNHPTIVDGLLLALLAPRKVRFVAAPELLKVPVIAGLLRWLGAIPAGREAVDAAVTALRQGHLVAIFPEGRTNNGRELLPFRSGAARIAALSGAPVVPFAVDGTQHVYPHGAYVARPACVRIRLGEPRRHPTLDHLHQCVHELWRECRAPLARPRWGVAAGVVVPLSLAITSLHRTASARRLRRRMEDAC